MRLPHPLLPGRLVRRYQRFLADIQLDDGRLVTAHCPNSGSMSGLRQPGLPVLLSQSDSPKRKLAYTWELVHTRSSWVLVHTGRTNDVAEEALRANLLPGLTHFTQLHREVKVGEDSRLDFLLRWESGPECLLEVKSVTLAEGDLALFPDAVTERGRRHLHHLQQAALSGKRAVALFVVQREDCRRFAPASAIDPAYAKSLRQAAQNGVEIIACHCRVSPEESTILGLLPVSLE